MPAAQRSLTFHARSRMGYELRRLYRKLDNKELGKRQRGTIGDMIHIAEIKKKELERWQRQQDEENKKELLRAKARAKAKKEAKAKAKATGKAQSSPAKANAKARTELMSTRYAWTSQADKAIAIWHGEKS